MCGNSEVEQSLKQYKILSIIQEKLEQNRRNLAFEFFDLFLSFIFVITIFILFIWGITKFFGTEDYVFLIFFYILSLTVTTPYYLVFAQFYNFFLKKRMINSQFINDCIAETYGLNDIDKSDVLDVFSRMLQSTKAKSFKKISYTKAIDFIEKEKEKYAVTNIIEMIEHGCYATQLT